MRLSHLAALAALTLPAAPALAQDVIPMDPPPVTAPIYPVDGNANYMVAIAGGTLVRDGNLSRITVVGLTGEGMKGTREIARLDSADEFRCDTRQSRSTGVAAYRLDGSLIQSFAENTEWEAVSEGSPNATILTFVCGGEPPTEVGADTVEQMITFYRGWLSDQQD